MVWLWYNRTTETKGGSFYVPTPAHPLGYCLLTEVLFLALILVGLLALLHTRDFLGADVLPDKVTYDTIICTAAFLAFAGIAEYVRKGPIEKLVSNISKYSYAIFLCHHYIIFCAVQYLHLDWLQQRDLVVLYIAHIAATAFVSTLLYRAEKTVCHIVSEEVYDLLVQTKAPL